MDTDTRLTRIESRLEAICGKLDILTDCIQGGASLDTPGLKIRVDRLEQLETRRRTTGGRIWALMGAVFALVGDAIYRYWPRGP